MLPLRGLFTRGRHPQVGACSHVGRVREENQDSYGFYTQRCAGGSEHSLYIVADGMGGHSRGAEASRSAVNLIRSCYFDACDTDPLCALRQAFEQANRNIARSTTQTAGSEVMGTTATAIVIADGKVGLAHVGDSRAYLITESGLQQLTNDHTYVNSLVQRGLVSEDEAHHHPGRHLLTQALGVSDDLLVEARYLDLPKRPCCFVLCSDGLSGVPEASIVDIARNHPPAEASRLLVDLANQNGGRDNVTVIVVRMDR